MSTPAELQQAQGQLIQHVFVPAFVKSCSERGINFQTQEQLSEALKIVGMVRAAEAKAAMEGSDPMSVALKRASAALESHLKKQGMDFSTPEQKEPAFDKSVDDALKLVLGAVKS